MEEGLTAGQQELVDKLDKIIDKLDSRHGYVDSESLRHNVESMYNLGMLNYDGGFKRTAAGRESSIPNEMLEVAIALYVDKSLIKKLRALAAANDIELDPSKVRYVVALYGLDKEEKGYVVELIKNHEERWGKRIEDGVLYRPNKENVATITDLLSREDAK